MENIVCLKHPKYTGSEAPDLSCRTCCTKYIRVVSKTQNEYNLRHASKAYRFMVKKGAREATK